MSMEDYMKGYIEAAVYLADVSRQRDNVRNILFYHLPSSKEVSVVLPGLVYQRLKRDPSKNKRDIEFITFEEFLDSTAENSFQEIESYFKGLSGKCLIIGNAFANPTSRYDRVRLYEAFGCMLAGYHDEEVGFIVFEMPGGNLSAQTTCSGDFNFLMSLFHDGYDLQEEQLNLRQNKWFRSRLKRERVA